LYAALRGNCSNCSKVIGNSKRGIHSSHISVVRSP
jgi:hypothetical protein